VAVSAVYLIFFYKLATWLWQREHYQFFPIVLIGAAGLAWYRFQDLSLDHVPRITFRLCIYASAAFCLLVVATVLGSNLIGSISGIISIWTLVWYYGGKNAAKAMRGPVFLTFLMMPLPLNLDLKLIISLQKIASAFASRMLDLQYIRHSVSGVAITTPQKSFMVEEACSGIHSLFSCICVVVFVSVVQRSGIIRVLFNIAQTVLWVIVANAIRVYLIVYSYSLWGISLTDGWEHEALGIGTYVIALSLSLSTDKLFQFLIPVRIRNAELSESPMKRLDFLLDRVVMTQTRSFATMVAVLALLFFPLAAIQYGRTIGTVFASPPPQAGATESNFTTSIDELLQGHSEPPATIEDWTLVGTDRISRDPDDPFGTNSAIFTYTGGGLTAQFSIDGFYHAWHDLAYCYDSLGWDIRSQNNSIDGKSGRHLTELSISSPDGEHGWIRFSCFDSTGQSAPPNDPTIGRIPTISTLLERTGWRKEGPEQTQIIPPVFQLQLLCGDHRELLPHEDEALRILFEKLCTRTLETAEVTE